MNIRFKKYTLTQWQTSVSNDYNYLLIVINNAFDYPLCGLLVLHKLYNFLREKEDI